MQSITQTIANNLNKKGYNGGVYHYKKGECTCCYGLEGVFFQISGNRAMNEGNQDKNLRTVTYKTDNKKKAKQFLKDIFAILERHDVLYKKHNDINSVVFFYEI